MSGILKGAKKVFKKVVSSKIFKIVAIAAAIYFTGGLAAGAMGSTFAASLPGISSAASALGITAGAFGEGAMALAGVVNAGPALGAAAIESAETSTLLGAASMGGSQPALGAGLVNGGVSDMTGLIGGEAVASAAPTAVADVTGLAGPANAFSATPASSAATAANMAFVPPVTSTPTIATSPTLVPHTPQAGPYSNAAMASNSAATTMSGTGMVPVTGQAPSSVMGWLNDPANAFTAKALLQGIATGGQAAVGAIAQKSANDQSREDLIRRGAVPNLADIWRGQLQKPGIVGSGT